MQAIILAAGMGKRLGELTSDNTKCMVEVNGTPLIKRMLAQLDAVGLSRIVLVVGYHAEILRQFVQSLPLKTPVVYVENTDYAKTNNIYSLFLAREYLLQEDTLLLESDLIFEDSVLQALLRDSYPSLALVARYESWMDGTVVTLDEDCAIQDFLDKEHFRFADIKNYYKTVNLYKFSQNFSKQHYVPFLEAYCKALGTSEYYEQVLKVITKLDQPEIKALVLEEGAWYEIDDLQDLDIAESMFDEDEDRRLSRMQHRFGGYWRYPQLLDYCYLVNPFFPPQRLLDEIKANFETLACEYPSGQRVQSLLAAKTFGVDPGQIAVGNGAAELIKSLMDYIEGAIGIVLPTFEEYPNRKSEEVVAFAPKGPHFTYTAADLMAFFEKKDIAALVLINPDNPTGNYLPPADVKRLMEWAEKKGIFLVVDESFVDFASLEDTLLHRELLSQHPRLVVVKSISKSYGVPGFRLGVLASGNAALMEHLKKDVAIWNINSYGEFYLQICEKYKRDYEDAMARFYPVRDAFEKRLSTYAQLDVLPSRANYVTCRLVGGLSARAFTKTLFARHNVLVKEMSGKRGVEDEYVRISLRCPEDNEKLFAALDAVLGR